MALNSKQKGARGERFVASFLRDHGFDAHRGQQFSGSPDSPDVVSRDFPFHIESKFVERLNLADACAQAEGDCGGKPWVVMHKRNHGPLLATVKAEVLMELVRKTLTAESEPARECDLNP
jgi:Holliday junction resolvase